MPNEDQLLHIAFRDDWDKAVASGGAYEVSTRGATLADKGFIHCSYPSQIRGVAERIYSDADDLVLLAIDPAKLAAPIKVESIDETDGEYPHIYGPLNVDAVTKVVPIERAPQGELSEGELAAVSGGADGQIFDGTPFAQCRVCGGVVAICELIGHFNPER
jgi:uncharacterized protein (DUF952 family)